MPKDPDISVRRWIKWGDSESEEPTSTLVLTSPRSSYVDVRALLPGSGDSAGDHRPPATTEAVLRNCRLSVAESAISQLDWAFCGTSSRRSATLDSPAHGIWMRWVDSTQPNSKAHMLQDEGDLFPYNEGRNEELELEKGSMAHPKTQELTDYQELWASGDAISTGDATRRERICVVLKTVNDKKDKARSADDEERGMIIRVGQWVQGIVKLRDNVLVERWAWLPAETLDAEDGQKNVSRGSWRRVVCIRQTTNGEADLHLPCDEITSSDLELSEGNTLGSTAETRGASWKVEEVVKW